MTRYDMMMRGGFKSMEEFDEAQRREEERVQRRLSEENKRAFEQTTPNVEVQPVKRGSWIAENRDNRGYADCYTCTNCNCYTYTYTLMKDCEYDYCPRCGARMSED